MSNKRDININGSVSGIANFGDNSVNININEKSNIVKLDNSNAKKSDINSNNNFKELDKDKFSSNIVKKIIEIIIGITISVIAGYIIYKFNMN